MTLLASGLPRLTAAAALTREMNPAAQEAYTAAKTDYDTKTGAYRTAKANWDDFLAKHPDLNEESTAKIAGEEALNYLKKSLNAMEAYLNLVKNRLLAAPTIRTEVLDPGIASLDAHLVWTQTKRSELDTLTKDMPTIKQTAAVIQSYWLAVRIDVRMLQVNVYADRLQQAVSSLRSFVAAAETALAEQTMTLGPEASAILKDRLTSLADNITVIEQQLNETLALLTAGEATGASLQVLGEVTTALQTLDADINRLFNIIKKIITSPVPAEDQPVS